MPIQISNLLTGQLFLSLSFYGISEFLQMIRSRYQPSSNDASMEPQQHMSPALLQTVKAPGFQFNLLQEDIVSYFIAGKPLICIEPSSVLRTQFKFCQSPGNVMEAAEWVGASVYVHVWE